MVNDSLQKVLPKIASDINIVKSNMIKLVGLQGGTPKTKAESFFAKALGRENEYESKFKKSSLSPTSSSSSKSSKSSKGGGLFSSDTSIFDFIKSIANGLIKGALVALGGFGIAKLLENEEVRTTIKTFLKNMFLSVLDLLKNGLNLISSTLTENWPEIKPAIVDTFIAIKNLILVGLDKLGDLLSGDSGKVIWQGVYQVIKQIFATINKILSTEIEIEGVKVSLYTVVGALITVMVALKFAAWAAVRALGAIALGGGLPQQPQKGSQQAPQQAPQQTQQTQQTPQKGNDKLTQNEKTARSGKFTESGNRIEQQRLQREIGEINEKADGRGTARWTPLMAWLTRLGVGIGSLITPGNMFQDNKEDQELEWMRNRNQSFPQNSDVGKPSAAPPPSPSQTSSPSRVLNARDLLNEIGKVESRGSYDATLGFGAYDPDWYKQGSKKLSDLSMDEIYRLQTDILKNPRNSFNSSAVGKYQIVRSTLFGKKGTPSSPEPGSIAAILGLKPSDKFTPEVQEDIGMALLKRRGLDDFVLGSLPEANFMANLQKEWQGFRNTGIKDLAQLQLNTPRDLGGNITRTSMALGDSQRLASTQVNMVNSNNVVNNNSEGSKESTPATQVSSPFDERMFFESMVKQLFV
jgi:hypothetical protein